MGQAWVDGFLPYTFLWDVKPPLTFLFYATVIFLFGKSILVIRLIGALLVALTAFFTYSITLRLSTQRAALLSGIACVFLQSMFGSIQGVMSEHILMVFFMAALYLLISKQTPIYLISAGFLLGVALMIKISIAFPILLIGLYLLFRLYRDHGFWEMSKRTLYLAIPALLILLVTIWPYYASDKTEIWWKSVVLAPLAYTDIKRNSITTLIGLCIPILGFIIWAWNSNRLAVKKPEIALLVLSISGLVLSFLKGGRMNSHYLIQLYPPLLIVIAVTASPALATVRKEALKWIFFVALLLPVESYLEYWNIVQNKIHKDTFYNGEGFTVPAYIRENNLETDRILFLGYHIGYWVLDVYPPTMTATHPSNICKSEMFPYYNPERETALEELRYIMEEIQPPIVITRTRPIVFDKELVEENKYIKSVLSTEYTLVETIDKAFIYSKSK